MKPKHLLTFATLLSASGLLVAACGDSNDDPAAGTGASSGATTGGEGGEGPGPDDGACLLHNCENDEQCATCSEGRNTCLVAEKRCVACGPDGKSCPPGQVCSSFGKCVPEGLECPTDPMGNPTISCTTSADCAACDPAHQVCNELGKCVACTEKDTAECQSTDICVDYKCTPACPKTCSVDNDCAKCGSAEHPAKACNAHKCAECSPTYACPAGEICTENGVCVKPCGIDGMQKGTCDTNADCTGCGEATGETYVCEFPINGAVHGKCVLAAPGCSDLGQGTVVMPEPWSDVTNFCSNDGDCAGVGVDINVGKMLRDLTGLEQIQDANVTYSMNVCAEVDLANDLSCGLCVPCEVDSDCTDIDIDKFALEAFGPIGSIAAAILLDQVFGPNEHKVHMYCETIAAGYGVCAPCPGVINDCSIGGGGGGGSGSCDHDVETTGGPLDPSCGPCESDVCTIDPYCCTTEWDQVCVNEVAQYCSGATCDHGECETGGALHESCSNCAATICSYDPYCCETAWDQQCVDEADADCGGCN